MDRPFAVVAGIAMVALASAMVAPAPATAQDGPDEVRRLAGGTRITTAVAVSEATFTSADTALLARADDYPDALTGTVLAHARQAPLLLTDRDRVPGAVTGELERLGVEQVILLGGTTAISNEVLDDLAADHRVSRVSGPTRWATAVEVAEDVAPSPDTVILATGQQFPDAVAVSAYAAHQGWPVLLTGQDELPSEVSEYLDATGSVRVVPVGGRVAIADAVLDELEADGHDVAPRLAGPTRWATSHRIATVHANALGAPTDLWVATGEAFPDALTAGVAAAASGALLQLTPTNTIDVPDTDRDVLGRLRSQSACTGRGSLTDVVLVGGLSALSQGVEFQSWAGVTCTPLPPGRLSWVSGGDLWLAEPGGANARVAVRDIVEGDRQYPRLSPTGRRIAVSGLRQPPLLLADLTTGAVSRLQGFNPSWSPDGSQIAYSWGEDPDFGTDVMVASANGNNERRLAASSRGGINTVVGWDADGSEVFYYVGYDDGGVPQPLYAADVATGKTRLVSEPRDEPGHDYQYTSFAVSPNRTHMAVVDSDFLYDEAVDILWLVDMATGEKRALLERVGIYGSQWAPDGSELAVATADGPVRVDVATGTVTPIERGESVAGWSPDGAHILMREDAAEGSTERLVAVDADGMGATVLTDYLREGIAAVWSPDGQWVAYVGSDGNIHQVSVDGQHRFQVSPADGQFPAWSATE